MESSIEVKGQVITRQFKGETYLEDVMKSWEEIFEQFPDLHQYSGVIIDLLDAELMHEDRNMNPLAEYLMSHMERIRNLKIAVLMDSPMVTHTIILSQKVKQLQIKPFSHGDAAADWILN